MAQHPMELILARQLAELLSFPIVLVDSDGNLVFYNEPAEALLGVRYEEAGELPYDQWSGRVRPIDPEGRPLDPTERPIPTAIHEKRPSHARFRIETQDGALRHLEITAIPLTNQNASLRGTLAIFWEVDE